MSTIEFINLTKKYGAATALNDISLSIESGEFLVLLGPSGCGKTTLLRCLAGLETPDQGEILIDGKVMFSAAEKINVPPGKRDLGMVFQSYALWPHMTVRENTKFGLDAQKVPNSKANARIDTVLGDLGMQELGGRYPSELSGGQQQRVALARLLVTEPPVFLMDEPLSNLDARLRMDMRVELKRFQSRAKATTVYVTHDQTEAMTMSTRVVVMKDGEIQQASPPAELYLQPANTFVADFIGMPRINLIEVEPEKPNGKVFTNGDIRIDVGRVPGVGKAVVGARPEDLKVSTDGTGAGESYTVTSILPNGPETIVQLTRGKTVLIARMAHDVKLKIDQVANVEFNTAALNIYDATTGGLVTTP